MPTVAWCVMCDRLAELPFWYRTVARQTASGEVFFIDVRLCLECEERTRPAEDQGEADQQRRDVRVLRKGHFLDLRALPFENVHGVVECLLGVWMEALHF